jgi:hypothetical protein
VCCERAIAIAVVLGLAACSRQRKLSRRPLTTKPTGPVRRNHDKPRNQDESSGPKAAGQDAVNRGEFTPGAAEGGGTKARPGST